MLPVGKSATLTFQLAPEPKPPCLFLLFACPFSLTYPAGLKGPSSGNYTLLLTNLNQNTEVTEVLRRSRVIVLSQKYSVEEYSK